MSPNKRRRRRSRRNRRAARILKLLQTVIIAAVVLGVGALGIWLLFEQKSEPMIPTCIVEYEDLIRQYAEENGIPPAYAASVIMAESSYRPDAVSSVGARGLMQIMPKTGEWIAGKYRDDYHEDNLFDPETNIRYGCWYLGFLMKRYDGNMSCSSAAYHAGQGTVDKWLENPDYSADGKTLDVIAYDSTATYVKRILNYYDYYEDIYA